MGVIFAGREYEVALALRCPPGTSPMDISLPHPIARKSVWSNRPTKSLLLEPLPIVSEKRIGEAYCFAHEHSFGAETIIVCGLAMLLVSVVANPSRGLVEEGISEILGDGNQTRDLGYGRERPPKVSQGSSEMFKSQRAARRRMP
jgi:hypothetical protein